MNTQSASRTEVALSAAHALSALTPQRLATMKAVVGFDGFIDSIIHVVDKRHSMKREDFARINTIPEFAARCGAAANRSANIELVVQDVRFGGNGPLFSSAMGRLGPRSPTSARSGRRTILGRSTPSSSPSPTAVSR
jgi:hypothetical protein